MDSEIIISFLNEAVNYLPSIRQSVDAYQKDGTKFDELDTAYRHIHTVNGALMMIGLAELSETAKEIEDDLEALTISKKKLTAKKFDSLLLKMMLLESALIDAKDAIKEVGSQVEPETFTEQFEEQTTEAEVSNNATEEDFELDEEMLEVFKMEAEDLLRSINAQLEILENNPNEREALMEIRRNSHT